MKSADTSLKYTLRLIWAYKDVLRNHFSPIFKWYAKNFRTRQIAAAERLQGKNRIEVAFLLTIPGMWKSDYLFQALSDNPKYHPYIVIYPYSVFKGFDKQEIDATIENTRRFVEAKGFEYIIPYDAKHNQWEDIKKTLKPDIVIFTTPYKDIPPQYFIYNFKDTLTCYVPYGFSSLNLFKINYDLIFHNLVGLHFVETEIHKQTATEHSRNKGENIVVTGYPGTEVFLRNDYIPNDVWKPQTVAKKRIIWAPHHTIDGDFAISSFLQFCDTMPKLAMEYSDKVQFVFKPHQLLKFKLQQIWGLERTEKYYRQWQEMPNCQLEECSYIDLFLTSDAMIHDCGSFTTEYLFTRKPVMYLIKNEDFVSKFSPFGLMSFNNHYQGRTENDIRNFIESVVINGNDPMQKQRGDFFDKYLAPHEGKMPSEKIIETIENAINGGMRE
ncbi:MAG: CDP-glycerol glycerophosphotransferase family protein [Bacteroidales bacterium]|nr:CDP-glycerol glycerophosphotransferase family protein [Bacteroidales bacterium]